MHPDFPLAPSEDANIAHIDHRNAEVGEELGRWCMGLAENVGPSLWIVKQGGVGLEEPPPFGDQGKVAVVEGEKAAGVHFDQLKSICRERGALAPQLRHVPPVKGRVGVGTVPPAGEVVDPVGDREAVGVPESVSP